MVATASADPLLDGVYTRSQAAYLARLRPQTLTRWFDADTRHGPAVRRLPSNGLPDTVTFVDLFQLMAARSIRMARSISLQKIREVTARAEQIGYGFPLALEGTEVFLLGDVVVLRLANGELVEATGKNAKHYLMEPVVRPYLEGVTFDAQGVASEYRPAVAAGVLLSPRRQWGAPVIERSNYTVATLVTAVQSEGSVEAAARICDVPLEDVRLALRYDDFLRGAA